MDKHDNMLLNAAWAGDLKTVVFLLFEHGADPATQDLFGNALQCAMEGGPMDEERQEICDLLFACGADPYAENCAGESAVETAERLSLATLYFRWMRLKAHSV
ncbi:MAG TPA: hypothetical protein VGW12_08670 [Pyrinomonadaceae bacterium]|nr:hypothetical protein [Pyrinomonadaceae bacterium]